LDRRQRAGGCRRADKERIRKFEPYRVTTTARKKLACRDRDVFRKFQETEVEVEKDALGPLTV
jgi:hypothetical protein